MRSDIFVSLFSAFRRKLSTKIQTEWNKNGIIVTKTSFCHSSQCYCFVNEMLSGHQFPVITFSNAFFKVKQLTL